MEVGVAVAVQNQSVKFILPDGSSKEVQAGSTFKDFIESQLPFLKNKALAVRINGTEVLDLSRTVDTITTPDASPKLEVLTFQDKEGWETFQHSAAHLLGMAVQNLYKDAKLTVGPVIENGPGFFYYDIDFTEATITPEDFPKIEAEMKKIVDADHEVFRKVWEKKEAISTFEKMGENYKIEIIGQIPDESVSIYGMGEWFDLCRGPHIPRSGFLKAFKLTAISGAYWKADKNNRMLTRIYGIAFPSKKELDDYLFQMEEAKKRDHRKIGKEMDLFSFQTEAPGFPFWHPKGTSLWNALADYIRKECAKRGYQEIKTPAVLSSELWRRSGHWENFNENMYFVSIDEEEFAIKPMNCPGCSLIYKHHLHSYRELPLRFAELGSVHRHELHGVLHGLFRVRAFTQDDAHIYAPLEYLEAEVLDIIDFTFHVYKKFGFQEFKTYIATRPEKSQGRDEDWEFATNALKQALEKKGIPYEIKEGEGAFYGPKIEFNIKDSIGRMWQCGTVQIDFSMPDRFELDYTDSDGAKKRPVMVHRAIYGSLERFIGILIEHFEGKFPLWLSPSQVRVLTVTETVQDYGNEILKELVDLGYRAEGDFRNEKIGAKIRDSILKKANYLLILGQKEKETGSVAVRKRGSEETVTVSFAEFKAQLEKEVREGN
ncbi:threonine--tRNA ligase [Leptospira langatensis]|uniref:Threonine--tRNA ligase n=1 Tax=Leptospira langatensis TaxID=2484983 RepID=A0A5F1ZWM5_9LEPT|nr:threonine--tRNA ligase [Leptospira langatensis]TGK00329.1 threonine--tRNA ligase [Leptospira langatensis]TGL42817.1 threonine--tRNA ligase [Leptospira langatensis]